MTRPVDAMVLLPEWLPPELVARRREMEWFDRRLDAVAPQEVPAPVGFLAPPGAGSSTVARFAARRLLDRWGHAFGVRPRLVVVRTRVQGGATGVAAALLRHFDAGFHERGFSTAEILAGFLRRSLREARPVLVLLDDIASGGPDLAPIVAALTAPDRFLPEGVSGPPPLALLLAGAPPRGAPLGGSVRELLPDAAWLSLAELPPLALRALVIDRVTRALGAPPDEPVVGEIVHEALRHGRSAARALELLRDRFLPPVPPAAPPIVPIERRFDARVREAVRLACATGPADLKVVRAWEERLARAAGAPPLATTTFWRRIVRLEQAGILLREVRSGGPGGSTSTVRLLRPRAVDPSAVPGVTGTPRASSSGAAPARAVGPIVGPPAGAPSGPWGGPEPLRPGWTVGGPAAAGSGPSRRAPTS